MSTHRNQPPQKKKKSDKVYIAPSGVQKERIEPAHIFVLPFPSPGGGGNRVFLRRPSLDLRESACTPLFWNAFDLRGAGSCIHTHSQNAVMVTLLTPGNMFRISHQVRDFFSPFSLSLLKTNCLFFGRRYSKKLLYAVRIVCPSEPRQMIKGVRRGGMNAALSYLDTLEVPIIENTPNEEDLKDSMADTMKRHPDAAGVLVRRHGIYVWGEAGHNLPHRDVY